MPPDETPGTPIDNDSRSQSSQNQFLKKNNLKKSPVKNEDKNGTVPDTFLETEDTLKMMEKLKFPVLAGMHQLTIRNKLVKNYLKQRE